IADEEDEGEEIRNSLIEARELFILYPPIPSTFGFYLLLLPSALLSWLVKEIITEFFKTFYKRYYIGLLTKVILVYRILIVLKNKFRNKEVLFNIFVLKE
ncbi:hypothetical protein OFM35_30640, partial [Escherichia coli]|nr:hypothetical protein [Escherichia coli]